MQPVAQQIVDNFGETTTVVNIVSYSFYVIFILFSFPSNYVIDVQGCRRGMLIGTLLTTIGMIIKCFINYGFYIAIIGQVFAAVGQPFLINMPAKLAAVWFGKNERVIAITICVAMTALGAAVGFVLPTIFI